jgi:transcription initiation factor TFIIF subunit beta
MEGRIVQKLECKPTADKNYYKLKSESIRKASQPRRQVKQLSGIVPNFKPISNQYTNIQYEKWKKAQGKRIRDDKDVVFNMLFAAFEKHQYYNINDLQKITRQPMGFLKEVVTEICNYNLKHPYKRMWELKPEYRHYKEEVPVEVTNKENFD